MRNNLITTNNTTETIVSMEVAMMIDRGHKELLRDIRRYSNQIKKINETSGKSKIALSDFFQESTYISEQNKVLPCFNITRKGCEFIANKLTGQKGTEFTARYVNRFHELEEGNITTTLLSSLNALVENINTINTRLSKLEETKEQTIQIEATYKKPYNPWFAKMQPKYKLLEEYFDITRGQLYKNILWELENLYNIDTQQIQADYCYENNLTSCYPLEPYEFVPKYRTMIESIINSNLIKYGIANESDPIASTRHITIFDTEPKNKE